MHKCNKSIDQQPLVTIAIPIYNAECYLRDAIQSCINQTYKNWELLLFCDGSNDRSNDIAREIAKKDTRICVIDDGENRGLIYRLNQSIALARGYYYARMDADDIMYITRIEEQVNFLETHTNIDVVGTSIMSIDSHNNIVGSGFYNGEVGSLVHPSAMGRTSWFQKNPYSTWALRAEDMELWLRTSKTSKFYAIGKPLLFYREFGVPTFTKYYATQKTLIKIYANYKEYDKTLVWCLRNSVMSIGKVIFSALLALIGKTDIIISCRRRRAIPEGMCLTKEDLTNSINYVHE